MVTAATSTFEEETPAYEEGKGKVPDWDDEGLRKKLFS
eukprot:CAMPEP_0113330958 /NCGR_PEP_ID=MMETSP0010_2-20120614/22121_1 /TAXON_ID=216773 ORGANISM="Corethron hystrix, Strain 308" /NCGR_SAMPLE_ID=MMETSP0010_2 /ASSEMBLY_ACC=CAM_ASM_000155 /LENGTH=37 /DNA_ID=CAMNT_0000193969 /DNA_START=96 /DNA_END=209 /DNA_ORIENTATION=+ /assembly_acc=CAM_ASM_000155